MMSEDIKFKVWDNFLKRMSKSFTLQEALQSMPYTNLFALPYENLTLLRYTGRKDKYRNEVYDGDILRVPNEIYRLGRETSWGGKEDGFELVCWENKMSAFVIKDLSLIKEGYPLDHINGRYMWVLGIPKNSEKVGNKYENPEFMEIK